MVKNSKVASVSVPHRKQCLSRRHHTRQRASLPLSQTTEHCSRVNHTGNMGGLLDLMMPRVTELVLVGALSQCCLTHASNCSWSECAHGVMASRNWQAWMAPRPLQHTSLASASAFRHLFFINSESFPWSWLYFIASYGPVPSARARTGTVRS